LALVTGPPMKIAHPENVDSLELAAPRNVLIALI